jgi:inorganic phosphate transporter, PiT family
VTPILWALVIGTIAAALVFDVINGFHDAANSIATVVSTRVLSPRVAVLWAAFFNFAAMLVFAPKVANTISKIIRIDPADQGFVFVVLCGLIGAIVWDLLTWWWGLPTSSSHALLGGFGGSGIAYAGWGVLRWDKLLEAIAFIPLAPLLGFVFALGVSLSIFWAVRRWRPAQVDAFFRKGQLVSAALNSLGHGGNDAQKTMGVIVAVLVAAGLLPPDRQISLADPDTMWIILGCQTAMAVGTAMGGWRIVRTMGMKITKIRPVGGFCVDISAAATLFLATHLGIPVSTTHTITGSIIGMGATTSLSGVKWGVARRILVVWFITIPASAAMAAGCLLAARKIVGF